MEFTQKNEQGCVTPRPITKTTFFCAQKDKFQEVWALHIFAFLISCGYTDVYRIPLPGWSCWFPKELWIAWHSHADKLYFEAEDMCAVFLLIGRFSHPFDICSSWIERASALLYFLAPLHSDSIVCAYSVLLFEGIALCYLPLAISQGSISSRSIISTQSTQSQVAKKGFQLAAGLTDRH